ncbi:unnamed protein product, partial [Mesorhabditis spiculigera]
MRNTKSDSEWFYRLAQFSIATSVCSLIFLGFTLPGLYLKTVEEQNRLHDRAGVFKEVTTRLWNEKLRIQSQFFGTSVQFFSRAKRQIYDGVCKGCGQLACPYGPPGPPGPPGSDGMPGEPGNQGNTGGDGMDVQLDTEPEMPCVVCPGGPIGPRGPQGERGRQGEPGTPGGLGPHGAMGMDGPHGPAGAPGEPGPKGPEGPSGQAGKTAVAGIGIKGPKGPPGPAGMMGSPGPTGRGSVNPGPTGPPGPSGPMGAAGRLGHPGQEGPYGPPGDPGMPASYCPSDCGVSHILSSVVPSEKVKMAVLKQMEDENAGDHYYGGPKTDAAGASRSGYSSNGNDLGGWQRDEPVFKPKAQPASSGLSYDNSVPDGYEKLMADAEFRAKLARKIRRRKMRIAKRH